jgi:hypothetical protein
MGLPSASESESNSSGSSVSESEGGEDHEQEDEVPTTANPTQVSLPAPTLPRSQSTASIVSNLSVSGGPAKADNSEDKLSKFDKRFKTATSTDEEVLSKLFRFFLLVLNLDRLVGSAPDGNLDLFRLRALQNAPDYHHQEGQCCLYLHLHCVRI